jgi:hypothetical protein
MWFQVQADLEDLLTKKVYSSLLQDPVYRHFLVFAGMKLDALGDYSIPATRQKNFRTAAKIHAHIIVSEIEKADSLKEHSVGAKLCSAPLKLYRLWDAEAPQKREGVWWFEPDVLDTCKKNTPRSPQARKQWLREYLAVSLDWSKLNRIDCISLDPKDEFPAIVGIGNPVRVYSPNAVSSSSSSRTLPSMKTTLKEYWENLGKFFPGGIRQTILPFVPRATGMDLNALLNKG